MNHLYGTCQGRKHLLVLGEYARADDGYRPALRSLYLWRSTMTPIAPHISDYLRERLPNQRGASPHTCVSYAYSFQLLFEFASRRLGLKPSELILEQIDAQLVMDFLAYLENERRNSPTTRNARLAAIKSFMHFVEYRVPALLQQIRQVLAIPTKKTDQTLIQHLSLTEM